MEAPGGVEPPTNGLGNRCSIHLSYGAMSAYRIQLSNGTSRPPASTIGLFLVIIGFFGCAAALSWLFGLLVWDIGDWSNYLGSIASAIASVVLFHVGLFCLLK
jgi:hypothetical protein